MTRKKVKLAWVENDTARINRYWKRMRCVLKKMGELVTLCDVSALVIIYGPDNNEPASWPSPQDVEELLKKYQDMPESDRCQKMIDQEAYITKRIAYIGDQLGKTNRQNFEMRINLIMHQVEKGKPLSKLEPSELTDLVLFFEEKMRVIQIRVKYMEQHTEIFKKPHGVGLTGGSTCNTEMGGNDKGIRLLGIDIEGSSAGYANHGHIGGVQK